MSDRDTKLKPCPFCGNEPTIVVRKGKDGWRDRYSILCDYEHGGCGAESGWYHYKSEAIESWNHRVSEKSAEGQRNEYERDDEYWAEEAMFDSFWGGMDQS